MRRSAGATQGRRLMPVPLTNSPNLVAIPAIELKDFKLGNAVVLDASSHESWEEMFAAHPGVLHFLLSPGNYEDWGWLEIPDSVAPAGGLRTIRYHNPGVDDRQHPVKRACHARVASLRFQGDHTTNWAVRGLTVFRPAADCFIEGGASNVTIDFCLVDCPRVRGCRIRNVSHCTIQRCVIRESIQASKKGDTVGVQVRQRDADEMVGIKILDNEIYNVGDGIQLTAHDVEPLRPVEVLMEGNDIYLEPSRYLGGQMTRDENAIDLKVGSDRLESTIVRKNRLWGFRLREGSGAQGELITVQQFCRNLIVEDNIMGDAPRGMKDESWPDADDEPDPGAPEVPDIDPEEPRHVVFRRNQFYEICDRARDDEGLLIDMGAITRPITTGLVFEENWFARSDYLADWTPAAYERDIVYRNNTRVEVPHIPRPGSDPNHPVPYHEPPNRRASAPFGYDTYERKRWTGPEHVTGAIPAALPATHEPPEDPVQQKPDQPS
jgi:hypothetical protein